MRAGKMKEKNNKNVDGIRNYGASIKQGPDFQAQIFSGSGGYRGTDKASEGRLFHRNLGLDSEGLMKQMKKDLLKAR